jgi:glycine C-acetyltransferase
MTGPQLLSARSGRWLQLLRAASASASAPAPPSSCAALRPWSSAALPAAAATTTSGADAAADPLGASLAARRSQAESAGTWKTERVVVGPQGAHVRVRSTASPTATQTRRLLNACANNYLGLANHPRVVAAAKGALDTHGFGLASVRFIVGTTDLHVELERRLSEWLGAEDCILFPSCFDANAGVFEALLSGGGGGGKESGGKSGGGAPPSSISDAIISDTLNHASIIDGVRLCKARRYRFPHRDVEVGLRQALEQAARDADEAAQAASSSSSSSSCSTIVVTDGVFSMDGTVAPLDRIVPLIREFNGGGGGAAGAEAAGANEGRRRRAYLMVDDCHATGFWGATGRGTAEACGLLSPQSTMGGVDLLSSTLGKALGGATGGFIAGRRDAVAQLRQSARPYLFSNTLAPSVAAASLEVLDIVQSDEGDALRRRLRENAVLFRRGMEELGFEIGGGVGAGEGGGGGGGGGGQGARAGVGAQQQQQKERAPDAAPDAATAAAHPIVPVMLGDASLASEFARRMLDDQGVYVVAFSYPVVPKGKARIRVQMSAAHSQEDVKGLVAAFAAVGREMGVLRRR